MLGAPFATTVWLVLVSHGAGFFICFFLLLSGWVAARLGQMQRSQLLNPLFRAYTVSLLPLLLTLATVRAGSGGLAPLAGCEVQLFLLGSVFALLCCLVLGARLGVVSSWSWEYLNLALLLQVVWCYLWLATTVLAALLWLEIAGLLVLLILTVTVFGQPRWLRAGFTAPTGSFFFRQLQLGYLRSLLALLWAGGFAALFILWATVFHLSTGGDLERWHLWLATPTDTATPGVRSVGGGLLLVGLLFKLMLQPFQFFLVVLYRRLPTASLAFYLGFYYIFLVPALVAQLWVVAGLTFAGALALLALLAGCAGVFVLGGLGAALDIRSALTFSTVLNLSLLLLAVTLA